MSITTELEYKFINIDIKQFVQKLHTHGAEFVFDVVYKIYNHDRLEWRPYQGRVRLREADGKTTMAYKAVASDGFDKEVEFDISDIEKAHQLLKEIDIPVKRVEQKRRIRYMLGEVEIDIDFWPGIDPYVEIEASSHEQIEKAADTLGLDMQDGLKKNAAQVYKLLSGESVPDQWVFEQDDWRLTKFKTS